MRRLRLGSEKDAENLIHIALNIIIKGCWKK